MTQPEDKLRVLVAEDDEGLREIMHILLEPSGHDVGFAATGAAVVELAGQTPPDVVIVDLGLPDMDGFEVARELRRQQVGRNGPARIVAFTGYEGERYRRQAEAAGFDLYLRKPMDLAEMEAAFGRILGGDAPAA